MFHALSKVLDLSVTPLAWAVALVIVAVALTRRRPRASRAAGLLAVLVLAVFGSPRVANLIMASAERDAPRTWDPAKTYDAVVVLGGMLDEGATKATGAPQFTDAVERLLQTWELFRSGRARNVLISGRTEAEPLRAQLIAWGVPADRIFIESVSANTRENAVQSKKVIAAQGWKSLVLVTSAFHMPRALGCFRREGLDPDALPVDVRAGEDTVAGILPREHGLAESSLALREFLGRAVYRAVGYSK